MAQQSLIRAVSDLQGRGQVAPQVARPVDDGLSEAMSQVAATFAGVGDKIGRLADHAAQREGEAEGRAAGLDPEFRTRRDLTIRGEAFDKAGLDVAETRLRTTLEDGINGLYEKHAGDPQKLAGGIDGVARGVISNAPDELRPSLELLVKGKKLSFMREATRARVEQARAESAAALQADLTQTLKGMHQRAFALGLDAAADEAVAGDLVALGRSLGRKGIDGKPLVAPAQAQKLLAGAREEVTTARLYGAFQRLPSIEAKEQFLKTLDEDFAASKGLAKEYDLDGFQRVTRHLEGELRSAKVEARAVSHALKEDVAGVQRMAEKGFALPPDRLAAIKSRVAMTTDPELQAGLAEAENLAHWQASARKATPQQIDGFIRGETARLRRDGAEPRAVKRLEIAEKLHGEMTRELKANLLGWADRAGVLKVAPLDLSSADAAAQSMRTRMAQAEAAGDAYGMTPQYLMPDERKAISGMMARGGDQTLAIAASIAETGGERAPKIMAELADHAPAMALLGGHVAAAGMTPVAKDAANGLALRRVKDFKSRAPSENERRQASATVLGSALAGSQNDEAAALALADAIYEVRGHAHTSFKPEIWQQGLREVLGERKVGGDVYGGVVAQSGWFSGGDQVVIPANVKQNGWRELVDAIRLEDLSGSLGAPLHGDGKPASIQAVHRARLVQAGDGKYLLATGTPDEPKYLQDGRGEDYTLDLKKLEPILRKRRPDLYLGGR